MASYTRASYFRWLQGDAPNALEFIRYALSAGRDRRDPEPTAWTLVQAGMLMWHQGRNKEAEAAFTEALAWVPDYAAALVGRGRVALSQTQPSADAAFERGDYTASLQALAALKAPVDAFFASVMVNTDEPALRINRLGLLATLHAAMNRVADLSKLAA